MLIVTPQLLLAGCDSGELVCIADNVGAGDSAAADVDAGDSAAGGYRSNDDGDSGDSNAGAFGGNTFFPYSSQLEELLLMGIDDADKARAMLIRHNGDAQKALNAIFDTPAPAKTDDAASLQAGATMAAPVQLNQQQEGGAPGGVHGHERQGKQLPGAWLWTHRPAAGDASAVTAAVADVRSNGHSVWVVGLANGTIKAIGTHSGELIHILRGHSDEISHLSSFKNSVVSASLDSTLRIWDTVAGLCQNRSGRHDARYRVFLSLSLTLLISCSLALLLSLSYCI